MLTHLVSLSGLEIQRPLFTRPHKPSVHRGLSSPHMYTSPSLGQDGFDEDISFRTVLQSLSLSTH
ncbi:hypothetical protein LEMLEM_LOCUS6538 [Lemmus lemmus]